MPAGTSGYPILETVVPGIRFFRFPSRTLFLTALAVAVLAGMGVDAIASAVHDRVEPLRGAQKRGVPGLEALAA